MSEEEIHSILDKAYAVYKNWRNNGEDGFKERIEKFSKLKEVLNERRQIICETITNEMGKPIKQTAGEIDKAIALIDYYIQNASEFLANEPLKTKFPEAFIQH